MKYILGVDGGGTHTRALLADETGTICGRGSGGPANYHSVGIAQAVRSIRDAAVGALRPVKDGSGAAASGARVEVSRWILGLAGVGRDMDHAKMLSALHEELQDLFSPEVDLAEVLFLTTDAHIALTGAVGGEEGVVVIAGTGAIALGTRGGRLVRAGGWGYLLDDRGGGYDLGRQAIIAALRAFDGRGEQTVLAERICRQLQLTGITDLVGPVHNGELDRMRIGGLAALVTEAAGEGDRVAMEILREGGRELALLALAVAKRLGFTGRFKIAGTGGVLSRKVDYLYPDFAETIHAAYPEARVEDADVEPVYGAILLGARQLGLSIEQMIRRWNHEVESGKAE